MKMRRFITVSFLFFMFAYFLLSPVRWNEKEQAYEIRHSRLVNRSACAVYDYLGQSEAASQWSSFVSRIEVLNPEIPDGTLGLQRKCFAKDYPALATWEEEILQNENCEHRRLSIYNLENFPIAVDGLFTDQVYTPLEGNNCQLSLAVYFPGGNFWDTFKFILASPYIASIFSNNLKNIKNILEHEGEV